MSKTLIEQFRAARTVATPLLAIQTADPPATVAAIVKSYRTMKNEPPILQHDIIRGIVGLNDAGVAARRDIEPKDDVLPSGSGALFTNPSEAVDAALRLPERAVLFMHNAHALIEGAIGLGVRQAICNARDPMKEKGQSLVLLGPAFVLPGELVQDVYILDEPLPDAAQLGAIIDQELTNAQQLAVKPPIPDEVTRRQAVEALGGLAYFPAEQAVALSMLSGKLDPPMLQQRRRKLIGQTRGLVMEDGRETFADVGGCRVAQEFGSALFAGRKPPVAIVRIDEIEKMIAGAAGDTSGVSQDALGTILQQMEDQDWAGLIAVGPPGGGKTLYSRTLGRTHGAPTFALDLGAAKGSLVGQSEERIRAALKVIQTVAGQGAFFVATCNKLDVLPPELRRRFRYGLWFFDLPTAEERAAIWQINIARYELTQEQLVNGPATNDGDRDWTGADIRNVCELAWRLNVPTREAKRFIVPVSVSDPGSIEKLRAAAHQKFLSASFEGTYQHFATAAREKVSGPQIATSGRSYQGES